MEEEVVAESYLDDHSEVVYLTTLFMSGVYLYSTLYYIKIIIRKFS